MTSPSPHRLNNFDLVRLFGASEVVWGHSLHHFGLAAALPAAASRFVDLFPGVPIFFVVSGFLISASLERSPTIRAYARNRALRIFPGLWGCFAVTLSLLAVAGQLTPDFLGWSFLPWVVGQLTVVQIYNPDALRDFGTGVVNGSLWTIPVEIGFYVMLPILLVVTRRTTIIAGVALLSAVLWIYATPNATLPQRLLHVTPLPHFWMFLLGALAYTHRDRVLPLVRGKFLLWLAAYLVVALVILPPGRGAFGVLRFALLALLTLSAAFSAPSLAHRLLRGNDISYGVYIYHMLVVNTLLWLGHTGHASLIGVTMGVTILLAVASWRLVERPALSRKRQALSAVTSGGTLLRTD